jgi:hypothetical protein
VKKKDFELELRCSELAVARMSNENSRLAQECAKLYADLIGRDIKIKKLIDSLTIATRALATASTEEGDK